MSNPKAIESTKPGQVYDLTGAQDGNPDRLLELIKAQIEQDPQLASEHSQRAYLANLLGFNAWRGGRIPTKTLIEQYAADLQSQGLAASTINQKLAAVRWWIRKLADLAEDYSLLPPDQSASLVRLAARIGSVRDVRGETLRFGEAGRHISTGELQALLAACESDLTPAGLRDLAMIAVAWAAGLRQSELTGLHVCDWKTTGSNTGELTIHGKGRKVRKAYIDNGAFSALSDWLALRGDQPGPVFCTVLKAPRQAGEIEREAKEQLFSMQAKITYRRLSSEAMRLILDKRIEQAKIESCTWHDFRRTFAGNLWGAGVDGATIQKLMGHGSQSTTAAYDRRVEETRKEAVKVLHIPYKRRL